jgi:hypothetical protein
MWNGTNLELKHTKNITKGRHKLTVTDTRGEKRGEERRRKRKIHLYLRWPHL